ncbi:DUF4083 domain-containing protein [Mangrovibacillus sp. Mu-81]|uniref:DUF4083 domain-containing protein n=1 Tax=Mangrovibacillus sp. Mu-81 TaxID=3121478 RepID=UPI002FE4BF90
MTNEEATGISGYHIGDILFLLFSFACFGLIISLIVTYFCSLSKRSKQLDAIERKVDLIYEHMKKSE